MNDTSTPSDQHASPAGDRLQQIAEQEHKLVELRGMFEELDRWLLLAGDGTESVELRIVAARESRTCFKVLEGLIVGGVQMYIDILKAQGVREEAGGR